VGTPGTEAQTRASEKVMRPRVALAGIWLAALVFVRSGFAQDGAPKPTVASLSWFAGTWSFERNGRVVTERWTPPSGGMMIGTSHTVAKEKTVEYEFMVLRADANGDVFYVARPSGQPEALFKLVRATEREAIFENPEHDFPQRILYYLKDDGTLLAAIEGAKNGKSRRVEFPYRRVN
jgi:hypothetical protein